MSFPRRFALALPGYIALCALPLNVLAQWVQHCEGPDGEMAFTASNCPPDHELVGQQEPSVTSGRPMVKVRPTGARMEKPGGETKASAEYVPKPPGQ